MRQLFKFTAASVCAAAVTVMGSAVNAQGQGDKPPAAAKAAETPPSLKDAKPAVKDAAKNAAESVAPKAESAPEKVGGKASGQTEPRRVAEPAKDALQPKGQKQPRALDRTGDALKPRGERGERPAGLNGSEGQSSGDLQSPRGSQRLRDMLNRRRDNAPERPDLNTPDTETAGKPSAADRLRNPEKGNKNATTNPLEAAKQDAAKTLRNRGQNDLDRKNTADRNRGDRREDRELRGWKDANSIAERIRADVRQNNRSMARFDRNFWQSNVPENRRGSYYHLGGGRDYPAGYWWRPTPVEALTTWLVGSWGRPVYYSYGSGGDVYYQDGYVYVGGNRHLAGPEYYRQVVGIVRSVPEISPAQAEQIEWKPLGVFALTTEESEEPSLIVQLAISNEGILSGTLYDEQTKETRPLHGMVEEKTQRAVWTFADDPSAEIVMETTLFNLTREETSVLVHFGADTTESWLMVRLPAPEQVQ